MASGLVPKIERIFGLIPGQFWPNKIEDRKKKLAMYVPALGTPVNS
jgi:hypothetical protein